MNRCGDMFENGSYLRRRKRFKLLTKPPETNKTNNQTTPNKSQSNKCSFFIDNLLANETNTSCTSSSSSPPSETNSTFQHLLYPTDFELVRKLTLLNDIHAQQQQVYW